MSSAGYHTAVHSRVNGLFAAHSLLSLFALRENRLTRQYAVRPGPGISLV